MRTPLYLSVILCTLLTSGCALTQQAVNTAEVGAAGNERYHVLVQKAFDGKAVLKDDGIAPITADEWKSTPKSVRVLVDRLLNGLSTNRFAFYSITFQLDEGPDPETLELKPVKIPDVEEDENAGLIDGNGDNQ
jgi:hypothetical protein